MRPYHELTEQEKIVEIFKRAQRMCDVISDNLTSLMGDEREQNDAIETLIQFSDAMEQDLIRRLQSLGIEGYLEPRYRP